MRYALIANEQVVLIVKQDGLPAIEGVWVASPDNVGPGFTYTKGTFNVPVDTQPKHITQLAFISRFTDGEAVGIDLASIGATVQAASIRRYLNKVNVANFIDLDRADTRAGVIALETTGLIGVGRAVIVLDTPVAEHERAS